MGKQDIVHVHHCKSQSHLDQARAQKSQPRLSFSAPYSSEIEKKTEAELKMAVLTAASRPVASFNMRGVKGKKKWTASGRNLLINIHEGRGDVFLNSPLFNAQFYLTHIY